MGRMKSVKLIVLCLQKSIDSMAYPSVVEGLSSSSACPDMFTKSRCRDSDELSWRDYGRGSGVEVEVEGSSLLFVVLRCCNCPRQEGAGLEHRPLISRDFILTEMVSVPN